MGHQPVVTASPRAHAIEAVIVPLHALFEAAVGQRAAFVVERPAGDAIVRYAYARDGGLVETTTPARVAPRAPVPGVSSLRLSAALHDAHGNRCGDLEAASLSGRPFPEPARAALEACARVLDAYFASHVDAPSDGAGTAMLDASTGLPNRAALANELERMLARAQRDDMTVFAVCIGLSGLDEIAGSPAFDRHVGALAACLSDSVRGGDLVARTGLHEFTVVGSIPRGASEASAAVVLDRLNARCAGCVPRSTPRARIDMGFAIARIGEFDPQALLAEAEENLLA